MTNEAIQPTSILDRRDLFWATGLVAATALMLVYTLDLAHADLSAPFAYAGDALQYMAVFRTVLTTGWYTVVPQLGAPFGATHYDAPVPDGLFLAFVSALRLFTTNPSVAFNILYIGGFLVVPPCFYYAARSLGIPRALAVVGALAYNFLPFHFLRRSHLFYTIYFAPPLVLAMVAKLSDPKLPSLRAWLNWKRCLLFLTVGCAGIYNAFFLSALSGFAGLAAAAASREPRRIAHGVLAALIISGSALANLVPSMVYQAHFGANHQVAKRNVGESELYGLKLVQLLLPSPLHLIGAARHITERYSAAAPLVTENATSGLGAIGAIGFLAALSLLLLVYKHADDREWRRIELLAKANGFLFLLATIGGLGTLFALLVSPELRAWNRASVVIGAASILLVLLLISRLIQSGSTTAIRDRRLLVWTVLLVMVWLIDQAPQRLPQRSDAPPQYAADEAFVEAITSAVPPHSMILELPYVSYPEQHELYQEGPYGMLRPYIHESSLRWSYGAMRGRRSDDWQRALAERSVPEQVQIAEKSGFAGIYIERLAYKDHGAEVERQLQSILGEPRAERSDGNAAFYVLRGSGNRPVELLPPVELGDDFYGWEKGGGRVWAWARGTDACLRLKNPGASPTRAVLEFQVQTLAARTVRVLLPDRLNVSLGPGEERLVVAKIALPPGETNLCMDTDVPARRPGTSDQRLLSFSIINPRLREQR